MHAVQNVPLLWAQPSCLNRPVCRWLLVPAAAWCQASPRACTPSRMQGLLIFANFKSTGVQIDGEAEADATTLYVAAVVRSPAAGGLGSLLCGLRPTWLPLLACCIVETQWRQKQSRSPTRPPPAGVPARLDFRAGAHAAADRPQLAALLQPRDVHHQQGLRPAPGRE